VNASNRTAECRIAMWSGPRNISTALMRSWGSRPDTIVCDEPFYAHYLEKTRKKDHPGYEEILTAHETDWRRVVAELTGPIPEGKTIFYQKHMAHHILPHMDLDWTNSLSHCLLIREPRGMLASLAKFLPQPTLEETGLPHQWRLFERLAERHGQGPPVLDASDVLADPRHVLGLLCDRLGVDFLEEMLRWEPGLRPTDGVWAKYWYANVARSTSFEPPRSQEAELPEHLLPLLDECEVIYRRLFEHRLH
jgi:hypothetical protein